MKPIVVVGSLNTDLVIDTLRIPNAGQTVLGTGFRVFPGGKGANQAVAAAKLGAPVAMVGKLGNDTWGDELLTGLRLAGVNTTSIGRSNSASGVALITVDHKGENTIVVAPGANAELSPTDIEEARPLIASAGMVLIQLETPLPTVEAAVCLANAANIPVMLDPAPAAPLSPALLARLTWLTPNETEAGPTLGRAIAIQNEREAACAAEELLARGVKNVLIKMGARGCLLVGVDGSRLFIDPFAVRAIDSTAAGDTFNAAFATALCRGNEPTVAARYAAAAAAISVTRRGAQSSMPTAAEVERFLQTPTTEYQ